MARIHPAAVLAAVVLLAAAGCDRGRRAEELELQRRQIEALELAQRAEAERLEALRREMERQRIEEETRARHESLVRSYARAAGRQMMEAVGGGRDLIVRHGDWSFDPHAGEFEIPMEVSFNGAYIRDNSYRVRGVFTVQEDGANPRFARMSANENFRAAENRMTAFIITAAGLMILNELTRDTVR